MFTNSQYKNVLYNQCLSLSAEYYKRNTQVYKYFLAMYQLSTVLLKTVVDKIIYQNQGKKNLVKYYFKTIHKNIINFKINTTKLKQKTKRNNLKS